MIWGAACPVESVFIIPTPCCRVLHSVAECCRVLQSVAECCVCCSVVQCVAVCCSVLRCVVMMIPTSPALDYRVAKTRRMQVICSKRATNYRALLRKMTFKNKASYESPCTLFTLNKHTRKHTHQDISPEPSTSGVGPPWYVRGQSSRAVSEVLNDEVWFSEAQIKKKKRPEFEETLHPVRFASEGGEGRGGGGAPVPVTQGEGGAKR